MIGTTKIPFAFTGEGDFCIQAVSVVCPDVEVIEVLTSAITTSQSHNDPFG
jgi:hypothetical protein